MCCHTDLNRDYGSLVLTQLIQLLLHVAEDDRARRNADTQRLITGAKNVLMLPLSIDTNKTTQQECIYYLLQLYWMHDLYTKPNCKWNSHLCRVIFNVNMIC